MIVNSQIRYKFHLLYSMHVIASQLMKPSPFTALSVGPVPVDLSFMFSKDWRKIISKSALLAKSSDSSIIINKSTNSQTHNTPLPAWIVKSGLQSGLNRIYLPMQLSDWLLVDMTRLLIGLTQISVTKSGF